MPKASMGAGFLAAAGGSWEPQRQNAFEVEIYDLPMGEEIISLSVDTASLPSITFGEIELNHLNERRYVAGGVTFETTSLVCKDFVNQDVMKSLNAWSQQVYNPFNGRMGFASDYKKSASIFLYGPDGGSDRAWNLIGCWPQTVNFGGTLDQSAKDAVSTMELTVRYDRAVPGDLSGGAGQGLGRAFPG
tara:strand:- start:266 stop:832 length:567 start_codon:yes stop_codon:yes gene_type:complete